MSHSSSTSLLLATERARILVEAAFQDGVASAMSLLIGDRHSTSDSIVLGTEGVGLLPITPDTKFDLASITKTAGCLPAVLKLMDAGELRPSDTLGRFFGYYSNHSWFGDDSMREVTIEELLLHKSGLPGWVPLFAFTNQRSTAIANVMQTKLRESRGSYVYSDLGPIALGAVVERVTLERIDQFLLREVFMPMGMAGTRYGPLREDEHVAATELCAFRGRMLRGEVHDENAHVLDGVSAHAGLFGNAKDLLEYGRSWLRLESPFCSRPLMASAIEDHSGGVGPARGWLWRLRADGWPFGDRVSERAFGHTGFTGTSLVVDPDQGWICVLLTNRVHPFRGDQDRINRLRRDLCDVIAECFTAEN